MDGGLAVVSAGIYSSIYGTPITDGELVYFAARTDEYPDTPAITGDTVYFGFELLTFRRCGLP